MRYLNIERDAMDRLAVTYPAIRRHSEICRIYIQPVWTLFDRHKPRHWLVAFYVLMRDGHGIGKKKENVVDR